jgi:carbamoyl-phosphate synthase large subunit
VPRHRADEPAWQLLNLDEKAIRRSAVTHRVPCITTMSGARATAAAIVARVRDPIRVRSLQEIHAKAVAGAG